MPKTRVRRNFGAKSSKRCGLLRINSIRCKLLNRMKTSLQLECDMLWTLIKSEELFKDLQGYKAQLKFVFIRSRSG